MLMGWTRYRWTSIRHYDCFSLADYGCWPWFTSVWWEAC